MAELRETDVSLDAMTAVAGWVDEARAAGVHEWDAMVVATATPDGAPSARIVLLRGVDDLGFRFYTSYESRKGRELDANPRAALVLHWRPLGRQVRAVGDDVPLPPFWGGYLVRPEEVELWQHRDDRLHDRIAYRRAPDGWTRTRLQP
jgi:pyridoxamine 5'-phosphate oxidase